MKKCTICNQTYTDDSLNFCLNDGGTLEHLSEEQPMNRIGQTTRLLYRPFISRCHPGSKINLPIKIRSFWHLQVFTNRRIKHFRLFHSSWASWETFFAVMDFLSELPR